MNLSSILVGQSGPASGRNSAGKPQRPTAVIGGRFPPDPFLRGALPDADRTAILGYVGDDDDLWTAWHDPSFAEDVELKGNSGVPSASICFT
jgi:hypothetical protein